MVFGRGLAVSSPSLPADRGGCGRRRSRREPDSGPQRAGGPDPASERPLLLAVARLPIAVGPSSLGCADHRRPQHPKVQAGLAVEDGAESAENRNLGPGPRHLRHRSRASATLGGCARGGCPGSTVRSRREQGSQPVAERPQPSESTAEQHRSGLRQAISERFLCIPIAEHLRAFNPVV